MQFSGIVKQNRTKQNQPTNQTKTLFVDIELQLILRRKQLNRQKNLQDFREEIGNLFRVEARPIGSPKKK